MYNEYNNMNYVQPTIEPENNDTKKIKKINTILIFTNVITLSLLIASIILFSPLFDKKEEVVDVEPEKSYTPTATTNPVSSNWTDYQFSINGKTLSLPCSYKELKDISGFYMASNIEKSYTAPLRKDSITLYTDMDGKEKSILYVDIKNTTEEDLLNADANIVKVGQQKYSTDKIAEKDIVTFPGNLTVGMPITKEEVIKLFGEPYKIDDYEFLDKVTTTILYTADDKYATIDYYEIVIYEGVIRELTLDHYDRRK